MTTVDHRTLYSIFISSLTIDADTKIISFLVPLAKDFILSTEGNNMNLGSIYTDYTFLFQKGNSFLEEVIKCQFL